MPDSAYFAAFESARGIGDSYLRYAAQPRRSEVEIGTLRYRSALLLFPFERELWPAIAAALGRHGREAEYVDLVRPIVDRVVRSRSISSWIQQGEPNAAQLASLRGALADSVVVMYLGFAEASGVAELEHDLAELIERRDRASQELEQLILRRDELRAGPDSARHPRLPTSSWSTTRRRRAGWPRRVSWPRWRVASPIRAP